MSAPPVPFYMLPPTRFTCALQTSNTDGALGDGTFEATYWVVGHVMTLVLLLTWGTTTTGTGNVLLTDALNTVFALPANWTGKNIDTDNMPRSNGVPALPTVAFQNLGGTVTAQGGILLVVSPEAVLAPAINGGITNGDQMAWRIDIPLVEPGMPR